MERTSRLLDQCQTPGPVTNVCVTGAAGNIAYSIVFPIGAGFMLPHHRCNLILLDIPGTEVRLEGIAMELQDCAFPLLNSISCTTDYRTAFTDCHVAMLIGARPRGLGMKRSQLLQDNAKIFTEQGRALNQYASRSVKIVVIGNPANTNALLTMMNAPNIPRENITAMTRLDQNRAVAQLSEKALVPVSAISGCIIWGNHSKTQYPDLSHARIANKDNYMTSLRNQDQEWIRTTFCTNVQDRGAAVIKARGSSSAASAAFAAIQHVREWMLGTAPGQVVSMAVYSDGGHYHIPEGIIYSFPVICKDGTYTIVDGLTIDAFSREQMDISAQELLEEKKLALAI